MPSRARTPRGLTLVELSVAIAIAAVLFAAVVVSVGAITGTKAKAAAGELSGVMRSLYDTAALTGKTCRLVFELPPERGPDTSVTYRAECATGSVTARADRENALRDDNREREDALKRGPDRNRPKSTRRADEAPSLEEVMSAEKDRVDSQAKFADFTTPEIQGKRLQGVEISVWTAHQRDPVKHGLAYLYFFPQGFTERAQVWFKQGSNVWTITVSSLTGKVKIVGENLEVPRS
jgi:general secretion pathway protein H